MITVGELAQYNSTQSSPPGLARPASPARSSTAPLAPGPEHPGAVLLPCRKRDYPSWDEAESARLRLLDLGPGCKSPATLVVYVCHACHRWHVGHELRETIVLPERGIPAIRVR